MTNLQEDIDNMVREMNEWRSERQKNEAELRRRNISAKNESESLLISLKQLDDEIKEKRAAITRVRANIVENERKIEALLSNL